MTDILSKGLLARVSIFQFNPAKRDINTTREVLINKNAEKSAGKWIKNIIDPKHLKEINSISTDARKVHYHFSLPWQDEGWRILPTTIYLKYQQKIQEQRKRFHQEVDKFIANYDQLVQDAQNRLGSLFNPSDYPSKEYIRNKFAFKVDFAPLPSSNDFRISLADMTEIHNSVEERIEEAKQKAINDLWDRIIAPVKHMVDKLSDKNAIFRDSLFHNIQEIIDVVPSLNITDNANLINTVNECKRTILSFDPDSVRKDEFQRQMAAAKAQEILDKIGQYKGI